MSPFRIWSGDFYINSPPGRMRPEMGVLRGFNPLSGESEGQRPSA